MKNYTLLWMALSMMLAIMAISFVNFYEAKIQNLNSNIRCLGATIQLLNYEKDSIYSQYEVRQDRIDKIHKAFKNHNPNVDRVFSEKFLEIVDVFQLAKNDKVMKSLISQIACESGVQHEKGGEIIESYAGAVGICQIMPNTAWHFFRNISCEDLELFERLGAQKSNLKNILTYGAVEDSIMRSWLRNQTNNIVMYGHIMRFLLKSNGQNLQKTLICYNGGPGMLDSLVRDSIELRSYEYLVMIDSILKK